MNRIYRVIWNDELGVWQAASELARGRGKGGQRRTRLGTALALALAAGPVAAELPQGGVIVGGSGQIARDGARLTITQTSARLAADWESFSIGRDNTVTFAQPGADAVALNRVLGSDVSVIQGKLNANGQVFLVNPHGILFSSTAQVEVGALVASTQSISVADFMAGDYRFAGTSSNAVVNAGTISTTAGGTIALIAARVINTGTLHAPGGDVLLAAGNRVTLDLGGPVKIEVEEGAIEALVEQGGAIRADGGTIYLTAKAAGDLASTVINHSGISEARTLTAGADGRIVLHGDAGAVQVAGTLDASAPATGRGGHIQVTGEAVHVTAEAHLNASGADGGGAVLVGGSWQNEDTTVAQARTTVIEAGALLEANATVAGDGGTVVAWSAIDDAAGSTRVHGHLEARGAAAGGDGGRIETSGYHLDVNGIDVSTLARAGATGLWLIDPYNITVTAADTSGMSANGGTFASNANGAQISIGTIANALSSNNVTLQTGSAGEQAGDIFWQPDFTYTGSVARTLTLKAHRDIFVDGAITSSAGALSLAFTADSDLNGTGGTVFTRDIETRGGSFTVNGLGAIFAGQDAQSVSTAGGAVRIDGEMIIANTAGLTVTTAGGDVDVTGTVNSGNRFSFDDTLRAYVEARNVHGATGDTVGLTYLATITSPLENTAAGAAAAGRQAWLGGDDLLQEGVWRWTSGPEGTLDDGKGMIFWTTANAQGGVGYVGHDGAYTNWNAGEPNDAGGAEDALQFGFSDANLWNDLPAYTNQLGALLETNLAASPLVIDAGSGTVTFGDRVGNTKQLASLDVTGATIVIGGDSVLTEGAQTYHGDVRFGSLAQFTNPSFEDGLTGWTVSNDQVYLNGLSLIGGFATPVDDTYPHRVVSGCSTATGANCDTTSFSGTFTTNLSNDVASGSGSQSLVMNSSGSCSSGYCITRGPYVVSDSTVTLPKGGMVSFKWQAKGGGDAYDVFGYLLNVDTGEVQTILNDTGTSPSATQLWTTAAVNVDQAGTYRFVFVSGSWDATGGRVLGAQLFIDDIQASGGSKLMAASHLDFRGTVEAADNQLTLRADEIDFHGAVSGSNTITLEQRSVGQGIVIGDSVDAGSGTLDLTAAELGLFADGFASITIGSGSASGGVTVAADSTFLDPLTLRDGSGGMTLAAALTTTAGNRLTLDSGGLVTQTADAPLVAGGGLELLGSGGDYRLDQAANTAGILAANTGSVRYAQPGAFTVGTVDGTSGITTSGTIDLATAAGNLTIAGPLSSADTSAQAIVVNAGRAAAAGDADGGNVVLDGNPAISTGAGGRAVIYTGSIGGSTGLAAKVGLGSGRFRYHSDESTTHFTTALGSGMHAIYRELPGTVTVRANDYGKIYDGQAYDGAGGVTITGLLHGDALSGNLSYTGGGIDVGTYTLLASGLGSGLGYAVDVAAGTLAITPRAVQVTASGQTKIYGDADPVLAFTVEHMNGQRGLLEGDSLAGSLARAPGENVGRYAIGQGTLANGNYAIAFSGADLVIGQRAITLAADATGKIYGDADGALTVRIVEGSLGAVTVADTLADVTGVLSRTAGEDVGHYDIALGSGARASNYAIDFVADNAAFTIAQRAITLAADATGKIYGDADGALAVRIVEGSLGAVTVADTLADVTGVLSRTAGEHVGSYDIALGSGARASNYAIDYVADNAAFTIAQRAITLAADATGKVYGEADGALTVRIVEGSLGAVTVADTLAEVTGVLSRTAGEHVGHYDIALGSGSRASNYAISYAADNAAFAITPRPLGVTARAQAKTYGDADPVLNWTAEAASAGRGLLAGDDLDGSLVRTAGENVGAYTIGQGTVANANYAIAFTGADLVIAPRAITLAAQKASKVYGEADPALAVRVRAGSLGAMTVADTLADVTGVLHRTAGEHVGRYDIRLGTGSRAANYVVDYVGGSAAFGITPRPVTLTAAATVKVFGTAEPTLAWSADPPRGGRGLLPGDRFLGRLMRAPGDALGTYPIALGNLRNPNYAIDFVAASFDIVEPAQTATAAGAIRAAQDAGRGGAAMGAADGAAARGGEVPGGGRQGGLQLVDIDDAPADAAGEGGEAAERPVATDRDARELGYQPVFVVEGGIRLPARTVANRADP